MQPSAILESALYVTDGFPQRTWSAEGEWLANVLVGEFSILGFRVYMSVFWFALFVIGTHYLLNQTRAGNWIQAAGGNANAARNRGVNVNRTKVLLFMFSAAMAAFAGIISSIRTSAANPNSGTGYELEVIAMVVIGGTVLTGGRRLQRDGFYFPPTVVTGVAPDAAMSRDEIFGPVAAIASFDTEDQAIRAANDTEYGLIAYVYTSDLARGLRVSERIDSGMIGVNRGIVSDPAAPFGGMKQSGLGREGAHHGIMEFCETKYVAVTW